MTLTADAIDHWTEIQPVKARNPLLDEMHDAGKTALTETDPHRQAFHAGLFTGYAVGFGLVTREALDRARRAPYSANVHLDFRRPRPYDDDTTLWACGVRHGYYLATSERPDADECALCGERLIEKLDDTEWCTCGLFCGIDGHRREWHAANGSPTGCTDEEWDR